MYKLKSIGDNFDPCGTPALIYAISEFASSIWTVKLRECRSDLMMLKMTVGVLRHFNL